MGFGITSYFPRSLSDGHETSEAAQPVGTPGPQETNSGTGTLQIEASCTTLVSHASRSPELTDELLLEQLRSGDKEALGTLFRRYSRLVRSVAHRILRDASEADDLSQEIFLFLFRKAALFDATLGTARSWIVQVTYHRAIDRRRYLASRHFYTSLDLEGASGGAEINFYERSIEGTLGREKLREIDQSLSEDQRQTIRLFFFEGYTLEEIAVRMGQAIGNVRNHYYRALDKIRKQVFAAPLRPE